MPPAAQALYQHKIEVFRAARDPYGFSALLRDIREEPSRDPEFDALLDTLADAIPADEEPAPARPAMPLDWLDAGPDEVPAPAPANDDLPPLNGNLVTKKRGARLAKSRLRDREDAVTRRAYRRRSSTASRVPGERTLAHTPITTPQSSSTYTPPTPDNENHEPKKQGKQKGKPGRKKTSRTRFLADWNDAGEPTRIDYVNRAVMLRGVPYEITLNLSGDRIAAANENERGPLDDLWRDINRQLAKALPDFDPALWIVLETTKDTARPHIHGGIAITHPQQLPAIREALKAAGGAWAGIGGQFQLRLVPQEKPDTWAAYATKGGNLTREHLREARGLAGDAPVNIACWSRCLIADAKRLLQEERRAIGRK